MDYTLTCQINFHFFRRIQYISIFYRIYRLDMKFELNMKELEIFIYNLKQPNKNKLLPFSDMTEIMFASFMKYTRLFAE